MKWARCVLISALALLLTGCRVDLYSALPEEDANQMLAILMQHNIDADKQLVAGGVTLRVEKTQFINAVELLRLNGFPRRSYISADTMFPPNQLVVSPAEEQQKILFLKEQRIENMLSQMDGVVHVDVTIASSGPDEEGATGQTSVAVFIKFWAQVNLVALRVQIKNLVEKSIPGVQQDQISILMQPAEFRMSSVVNVDQAPQLRAIQWLTLHRWLLIPILMVAILAFIVLALMTWRKRR
ncbi:EscJ/YscJ/HrcJ family type III secretion inner membrane ring protein SsaJ [Yersinia aldovae]|uniref:Lipoprotein n=1 Tax=Yersinia aldovae TaxID=29483 RepID=A0ABM9SY82_YERAL|nr:EscJ/YscJ/HrcJ family type III secretion inner membrane ring protein SsaJ [Yersinia aldovae]CNL65855.1 type III secretion system apparatus lipoprotein [Yersinia aldovae]